MPEEQREKKPVIDSRASSDAQARPSQHPRIAKSAARKSASIGSNVQGRSRPSTSRTQHSSAQALMATKSSAARKLTLVDGQDSFRRISKTLATPSAQDPFPVTKASAARKLTLIDDQDNSGNAPQAPAPNLATLLVKSSAARKLTLIDEQDSFRSRPSSSKPLPQTSDRSVASSLRVMPSKRGILSQPHFGLDRLQRPESLVEWRTSAARKNVQLMPPPAAPLAAARKYVAQQGRRLAASPPPKLMAAKKSAPQAALWAPSMRPAINPSSNKLPDPHHARASSNVPEQGPRLFHSRQSLLSPPSTRRRFYGAPPRKSTPLTGYIPSPPHANAIHVHQPARQPQVNHVVSLDVTARKTMQPLEPVWLVADSNYKASLGRKRMRDDVEWLSVPFMSTSRMGFANSAGAPRMVDEVKARIKPGLKFRLEGENESDDEIEIDEIPGPGEEATLQHKAARKYHQIARKTLPTMVSAPVSSDSPLETTSSDEKSESETEEVDELEGFDNDFDTADYNAPLSPPEELMIALEALTIASLHMQKARRLPFLLRELRRGFERRCQLVGVPTAEERGPISASVVYKLRVNDDGVEFGGLGPTKVADLIHKARMAAWHCPLCELHGEFKTRQMLQKHLTWDHDEVDTMWEQFGGGKWHITLIVPDVREQDELPRSSSPPTTNYDSERAMSLIPMPPTLDGSMFEHPVSFVPSPTFSRTDSTPPPTAIHRPSTPSLPPPVATQMLAHASLPLHASSPNRLDLPALSVLPAIPSSPTIKSAPTLEPYTSEEAAISILPTSSGPHLPVPAAPESPTASLPAPVQTPIPVEQPPTGSSPPLIRVQAASPSAQIPPKLKHRSPSPSTSRQSSFTASSRTQSTTASTATTITPAPIYQHYRQSISAASARPSRYPTPPPPSDPLGPSAQYPYLPAKFDNEVHYSSRPGGPRLYDLLNGLTMEHFGVLGWAVVDKEEEMFESDEVRDEDKVIQALWGRWIMLNRNKFVANHYAGTMSFVDEYWRIIHRAAGWAALRTWLLMLVLNRFLTGSEIVKIIKHYENLTGMAHWYKDQES